MFKAQNRKSTVHQKWKAHLFDDFHDELVTLHSIYKPNAKVEDFSNFIEENATELLLSVEATVFYNKNFNITSIQQNH